MIKLENHILAGQIGLIAVLMEKIVKLRIFIQQKN